MLAGWKRATKADNGELNGNGIPERWLIVDSNFQRVLMNDPGSVDAAKLEGACVVPVETPRACNSRILVEFVGAAGVGKSYMLGRLVDQLENRQIAVMDLDKVSFSKGVLGLLPVLSRAVWVTLQIRPSRLRMYPRAVRKLARLMMRSKFLPEAGGVCVRSEGVFHKVRQLMKWSRLKDMHEVALRILPIVNPPDVVVVLEASSQKIYEQRSRRRRVGDVFSPESVMKDVQITEESIRIIEIFRREWFPRMQVVRCDLEQLTVQDACTLILENIEMKVREAERDFSASNAHGS